jgi:signal transduction histidine kinase
VLAAELAAARKLVDDALDEARSAIRGLRPSVLDDLGLAAGLRGLARELSEIEIDVDVDVEPISLAPHVETALYRVGQEALQNVTKHAAASHVRVMLQRRGDHIVLEVDDDGRGFETGASTSPGSYGLEGMAERIDMVGGHLVVRSGPGHGTVVTATVPASPATGSSPDDAVPHRR